MTGGVLITGIGVVSPLAVAVTDLAARVAAGESALAPLPGFDGAYGASLRDLPLAAIPAESRARMGRLDRLCRLFLAAAYLAVEDARLEIRQTDADRVGLSFGTGLGCLLTNAEYNEKLGRSGPAAASPRLFAYTVSSAAAGEVSIALGIKGVNVTVHQGFAAGVGAIGYAYDLIRTGKADVVVAGGADALGDALVQGLADMRLLKRRAGAAPFHDRVPGICPSEGAGVLVLEGAAHARARGAHSWGRIAGYAAGFEPTLTHRDRESTALVETMRSAIERSGYTQADVDVVVSSAHATAVDDIEHDALAAVFNGGQSPAVLAPKAAWGECFAAHGALSVALAAALLSGPSTIAPDTVTLDQTIATQRGAALQGDAGRSPSLALIHTLCYSGPTVALLLAREE
jgi:3-oxoacyl-[acyl-carrier-protein] synthase II